MDAYWTVANLVSLSRAHRTDSQLLDDAEKPNGEPDCEIAAINRQDRLDRLTEERERLREALNWLLHLANNCGKAGGEPEPGELEAACEAAKAALTTEER